MMRVNSALMFILLLCVMQPCTGMHYLKSGTKKITKICAWIGAAFGLAYIAYHYTSHEGLKSLCAHINPWNLDIHTAVIETKTAVDDARHESREGQHGTRQTIINTGHFVVETVHEDIIAEGKVVTNKVQEVKGILTQGVRPALGYMKSMQENMANQISVALPTTIQKTQNHLAQKIDLVSNAVQHSSTLAQQAARDIQHGLEQNTQLGHASFNTSAIAAYTGMANYGLITSAIKGTDVRLASIATDFKNLEATLHQIQRGQQEQAATNLQQHLQTKHMLMELLSIHRSVKID